MQTHAIALQINCDYLCNSPQGERIVHSIPSVSPAAVVSETLKGLDWPSRDELFRPVHRSGAE